MVFQLKGVFTHFVGESVGTRISRTANSEFTEVPGFYYCNKLWQPQVEALRDLIECNECFEKNRTEADPDGKRTCNRCRHKHYRKVVAEGLVNSIVAPKFPNDNSGRNFYPPDDLTEDVVTNFLKLIEGEHAGSLQSYVRSEVMAGTTGPAHTIVDWIPDEIKEAEFSDHLGDPILNAQLEKVVRQRRGEPVMTLNGVCWKFIPGPAIQRSQEAIGRQHRHIVVHFGGYGVGLKSFTRRYGMPRESSPGLPNSTHLWNLLYGPPGILRPTKNHPYTTISALGSQLEHHLVFESPTPLQAAHPRVNIKFWAQKSKYINRRAFRCNHNWTKLDQAHCNIRIRKDTPCDQYLPASEHYPETILSNTTCLFERDDELHLVSYKDLASGAAYDHHETWNHEQYDDNFFKLTNHSSECPPPCEETSFDSDVIHLLPSEKDLDLCYRAIESILMDRNVTWGASMVRFSPPAEEAINSLYDNIGKLKTYWKELNTLPCTLVEYQQTEKHGMLFEEYPLYSLADLASNLGGTLGLWTGASVISFVQIIYIFCLERCFTKGEQRMILPR